MGEGAHLSLRPQSPPTSENPADTRARPGRAPASSPDTHNSPLPDFSQFFIHSTGTNTVAAAIFPSLLAKARMCSTRARGQSEAPPTRNAGNCEFAFRFPALHSSPPGGSPRPCGRRSRPDPRAPSQSDVAAVPSATLALASLYNRKSAIPRPTRSLYFLPWYLLQATNSNTYF